jgi:hypothetical protein
VAHDVIEFVVCTIFFLLNKSMCYEAVAHNVIEFVPYFSS